MMLKSKTDHKVKKMDGTIIHSIIFSVDQL